MAPLVLITGAAGLIGHYLIRTAPRWAPQWDVRGITRQDVDLTDATCLTGVVRSLKPLAIIHCAALSRTKDCEQDSEQARRINVEATAHLARLSQDIPFIFLSSGEVFDGRTGWYGETDEPNPINVYGHTKWEAERIVLQNSRHTVIRIVLTAGTSQHGDRSFVEDMCRVAKAGKDVTLYADEFRCPLPAGVIARVIWELVDRKQPGLYHLGGSERLSRWEIGETFLPRCPELKGHLMKGSARNHVGSPDPPTYRSAATRSRASCRFAFRGFVNGSPDAHAEVQTCGTTST